MAMIIPDWVPVAVRIVAVIKALAVAEAKLCDWKLAVLLWAILLCASRPWADLQDRAYSPRPLSTTSAALSHHRLDTFRSSAVYTVCLLVSL